MGLISSLLESKKKTQLSCYSLSLKEKGMHGLPHLALLLFLYDFDTHQQN